MSVDWEERWKLGDTPWDKGYAAPPLGEWLREFEPGFRGRVVAPGCGSGHDVRALAAAGYEVEGWDLSAEAVARAEAMPRAGSETYRQADLFEAKAEETGMFGGWWEHTCFCAIDPSRRDDYVKAAAGLIEPGGRLAGVFFLRPWDEGEEEQRPPFGVSREEIVRRFEGAFRLVWEKNPETAYPGREGREWLAVFERRETEREVAESTGSR